MKKRLFYHIVIKYLVAVILLIVTVFTGILGGWVLAGLARGIGIGQIANPVPYEKSSMAANYLLAQGNGAVTLRQESRQYCTDGATYDGSATVDISDLDSGVSKKNKNKNLEYRLDDLNNFCGTDEYWTLNELVNNGEAIAVSDADDAEYQYDEIDGAEADMASGTQAAASPEPLGPKAEPLGYLNTEVSRTDDDGEPMDEIPVKFRRYRELYNVLYNNGIELEKKAIQTAQGTTIADYAQQNQDTASIKDSYSFLLNAAREVHEFVNSLETGSNALVYIRNAETGECITNVPAWKNLTLEQVSADYEKTYASDHYGKAHSLYASLDEEEVAHLETGTAGVERTLTDYCRQVLEYWEETDKGNRTGQIFLGLNTEYPVWDWAVYDREVLNWYQEENPFKGSLLDGVNVFVPLIAGMAAIVFLLILLACQTGHRPEDREVHLAPIDYFPLEILLVMDVVLWSLMAVGVFSVLASMTNAGSELQTVSSMYPYFQAAFCALFTGAVALFAWDLKHYGRRIKAKDPGGSIIRSAGKAIQKSAAEFYRARKENQKLMFFYIGFTVIQFVVLGFAALFFLGNIAEFLGVVLGIALIIFDIFVLTRLLKTVRGRDEVKKGMEAVAAGNLDYQIDTADMSGANREMAQQINRMRDGLREAVEAEMKSERLKTDLITNVSHDIKTPLTSIINYVDILKREHIEDERIAGYTDILDRKSQRLKQLTEDLVEASKISSGNITLEMQEINLKQLIKQTNGEFEEKFAAKNLDLICELPECEMLVRADGRRMFRVIENLYNNAAKYAMPNSRVYVNGEVKGGKVIFSMKNMSENPLNIKADELMERFVRGDVSRSTEGSGLGLEIARNLTVMQQGTFDLYLDGDLFKVTLTFDAI